MSRNRSIAKRMGGEHTRTPNAGDKSYAKVLFSPDEMASFESLMNEVDDVGVGGKFITPRRGADAEDAPTSSFFRDWCTGLNAVVLVVLVVTAVVAVDFSRSYFPDRATTAGPRGARVDTTLEATPSPSPASRALAADLARAGREADPAGDAAAEGRREALLAAGSGAGSVVAEKGKGKAQTEANAEDVSEAETQRRRGDAADPDPFATPPFPETSANASANAAESDAWQSTAVGFGNVSGKQDQIARNLADALAAMDANVTRSPPPPPPSRGSRKSPPPRSDAARDAADAAEASAADVAEATSREARHEAAETDAERRARHAKEDEERRARHEKEDRERAEKHAMEDELRELRAAASERAKNREPFSFGEAEATTSVGALVADDATSDSASDSDPIADPDHPARVSVPHGDDGGDDDAPPDEPEPLATVSNATVPDDVEPLPGRSADDASGPFARRPADDDAIASDATPAGSDSSSPVMNASSALPTDPGEGSPEAGVTRGDAEPEAAATPAATPRRAGARKKKASTRENATNGAAETSQGDFVDEDIVETADAPTAPPRNATTTPNATAPEDPTDDAASLSDAPRLPEADPRFPDDPDEAPDAVRRVDADASHSLAAIADPPADYDHASLRVGVNATPANGTVADVGGGRRALAPPSASNGTKPGEYALDARAVTVKGLVQEPTDISDEAKPPPGPHAPEAPEPP